MLLLFFAVPALAQEAELVQVLSQLAQALSTQQGTSWGDFATSPLAAVVALLGGLKVAPVRVGPDTSTTATLARIEAALSEQGATVARIDERTLATDRELHRARRQLHRHANSLTQLAGERGVRLPPDDDDSDEPKPR